VVVSHVAGDRLCAGCGFHLVGQPIVREPRYKLLIVRCPECGTAAALGEYPALGRWAGRWAALLAAVWLVGLLGAGLLSVTVLAVPMLAMVEQTGIEAAEALADAQRSWAESLPAAERAAMPNADELSQAYAWVGIRPEFLAARSPADVLRERGRLWPMITAEMRAGLFFWGLALVGVSVFWAVALPHRRRWQSVLIVLGLWGAGFALFWANGAGAMMYGHMGGNLPTAHEVAMGFVRPRSLLMIGGGGIVLSVVACVFGRPLARGIVRLALPPRLRGPFVFLWRADGKALPRPGRAVPRT
jgi:hypothetical protein